MQMTTKEFAQFEGLEYPQAAGAIAFLMRKGVVKEAGKRISVTGKGKHSTVYEIPEGDVSFHFGRTGTVVAVDEPLPVEAPAAAIESPVEPVAAVA